MTEQSKTPLTDAFAKDWDSYNFPEEALDFARSFELAANAMADKLREIIELATVRRGIAVRRTAKEALAEFEKLKNQQP